MVVPILLLALAGFLAGGAWVARKQSVLISVVLALAAALAVAAGVLRMV